MDRKIEALKGDLYCPKCGTIVRDGRQYHDLVYRGEAEKHQLSGETSTISNKNSKDNFRFSKSVKLINPCNSLLKPDSDERKEQKSKLDCISRQQAIKAVEKHAKIFSELPRPDEFAIGAVDGLLRAKELLEHRPPVTPTEQQEHGRLIDADALEESIKQSADYKNDIEYLMYANSFINDINNAPTVITPTERTGEWEYEPSNGVNRCSVCGTGFRNGFCIRNVEAFNFCPNCGADMRPKGGDTE